MMYPLYVTGEWDEAFARIAMIPMESGEFVVSSGTMAPNSIVALMMARGRVADAKDQLRTFAHLEQSTDLQDQGAIHVAHALVAQSDGDHATALNHAVKAMEGEPTFGMGQDFVREALAALLESSLELREFETAEGWIDRVKAMRAIEVPSFVRAQIARFEARLSDRRGREGVEAKFGEAVQAFRDLGTPFHLAMTATEWAEWLSAHERKLEASALLEEAQTIFEKLGATPWAERAARAASMI